MIGIEQYRNIKSRQLENLKQSYGNILGGNLPSEALKHNNDRDHLKRENTSSLSQEPLLLRHYTNSLQYAFTFFHSFVRNA
jgi:hypothetical protein